MRMLRALPAVALAAAAFAVPTAPAQATHGCSNETGDIEVLDLVGVDYPGGNGFVYVCTLEWNTGVRVYSDSSGTCLGVIVLSTRIGCTEGSPF